MHWLRAFDIPEGARDSQGKALVNLLQLQPDEKVRAMIASPRVDIDNAYVVMVTKNGTIKKTELKAFKNLRHKGIIAITLDEDDDLIDAKLTDGNQGRASAGSSPHHRKDDAGLSGPRSRP